MLKSQALSYCPPLPLELSSQVRGTGDQGPTRRSHELVRGEHVRPENDSPHGGFDAESVRAASSVTPYFRCDASAFSDSVHGLL